MGNSQYNKAKTAVESGNISDLQQKQVEAENKTRLKLPDGVSRLEGNMFPPTDGTEVQPLSPKIQETYLDPYVDALLKGNRLDFDFTRDGAKKLLFDEGGDPNQLGLNLLGKMMERASEIAKTPQSVIKKYKLINDDYMDTFRHDINDKRDDIFEYPSYMQSNEQTDTGGQPSTNTSMIDHNDPTMLGFELYIDVVKSPLFDSSEENIQDFLTAFSGYDEIADRVLLYSKFREQFFKFFRLEHQGRNRDILNMGKSQDEDGSVNGEPINLSPDVDKLGYYIKSISGLSNLHMNVSPGSEIKQFVNFEKDKITLEFNEDVSMNFTYLMNLYKKLVWSSKSGKRIIPENLLRFDMSIVIYEIRNFNRVLHDVQNGNMAIVQDKLTKIEYNLYECQLNFLGAPHGDELNLWEAPKIHDSAKVDITYKYVDSALYKFRVDNYNPIYDIVGIFDHTDNFDVFTEGQTSNVNKDFVIIQEVSFNPAEDVEPPDPEGVKFFQQPDLNKKYSPKSSDDVVLDETVDKDKLKKQKREERKKKFKNYLKESANNTKKMAISMVNQQIRDKTILLNNLIFKGFMKFGLLGSIAYNAVNQATAKEGEHNITPPNNVYTQAAIEGFLKGMLQQKMGGLTNFFDDLRHFTFQKKK